MNKKFLFKIPVRIDDATSHTATLSVNTLLYPYYLSESAVLAAFVDEDEYETHYTKAREIAYGASLMAHDFIGRKLTHYPDEQRLLYARELALCYALNMFAKHFYKGYQESVSRSKTYGEFTVSTSIKNSPVALKALIDDSKQCIDELKAEIDSLKQRVEGLGLSHVKGICNPANYMTWRVWFNNNLPERSKAIFASEKVWYNGNIYKEGADVPNSRAGHPERVTRSTLYDY